MDFFCIVYIAWYRLILAGSAGWNQMWSSFIMVSATSLLSFSWFNNPNLSANKVPRTVSSVLQERWMSPAINLHQPWLAATVSVRDNHHCPFKAWLAVLQQSSCKSSFGWSRMWAMLRSWGLQIRVRCLHGTRHQICLDRGSPHNIWYSLYLRPIN